MTKHRNKLIPIIYLYIINWGKFVSKIKNENKKKKVALGK